MRTSSRVISYLLRKASSLVQSKAYINGEWVPAISGETFEVLNPANGSLVGVVPNMSVQDAQLAVAAAKRTFESDEWRQSTAKERSLLLRRWSELIDCHSQTLARIVTAESGKPLRESKLEVDYGNSFVVWYAEEARRIYGEIIPSPWPNKEMLVLKQPLGIVALITPWNFPLALVMRKACAALAAGCTMVVKPSDDTPLTALALAKLSEEAGIPAGVFNVVTTKQAKPMGELFCSSTDVQGISFTGSTEVGKWLYRHSAERIKRVSLELGGNAPFIVFESADLESAVHGALSSKFRNCGQTCVSSNRFFVHDSIYNSFVEQLKKAVEALKIGPGDCEGVEIGPLINQMQYKKVHSFVEDARQNQGKVLSGGHGLPEYGENFYKPTIIADVLPTAKLYTEEVFGPIVSIVRFKTEQQAVAESNKSLRGLAGYFYSRDMQQVLRVAKRLEVGMVGANTGIISAAEAPFGGLKESGIGREGCHHGIDECVEIKYICLGDMKY